MTKTNTPISEKGPQIYKQEDDGTGKSRHFDVSAMLKWAKQNVNPSLIKPDEERAAWMLDNDVVNIDHVAVVGIKSEYLPIVICRGASVTGEDLIVDGNHRYVAFTHLALKSKSDLLMEAFFLEPQQWKQFVVPDSSVAQLGLRDPAKIPR